MNHIPHEGGFPDVDKALHGLVPVRAEEKCGLVFVTQIPLPLGAGALDSLPEFFGADQRIFAACAAIAPSPRGELELPDAVVKSMQDGAVYRVVERFEPVLDLSSRDDIAAVRTALANHDVRL